MTTARGRTRARAWRSAILQMGMVVLACAALGAAARAGEPQYGPFGPEGPRMREQLWIVPSGDANTSLRATVFRPSDTGPRSEPRPLVVINHGTDEATRLAVSMPVYYWMSRWFVERGFVVVLPQRRGHGATGGALVESVGTCEHPDHYASGNVAADDVAAVVNYMTKEPFIASKSTIVVGVSTGGWASLALAGRNLPQVQAVVNFAGGRGGHAFGRANAICGTEELLSAAQRYARGSRVPTIWFYAENDSYFGPRLAESLAQVWSNAGGSVEEHILPPYGRDGHSIADDRRGWDIWGPNLAGFLSSLHRKGRDGLNIAGQPAADLPSSEQGTVGRRERAGAQSAMIETSTVEAATGH